MEMIAGSCLKAVTAPTFVKGGLRGFADFVPHVDKFAFSLLGISGQRNPASGAHFLFDFRYKCLICIERSKKDFGKVFRILSRRINLAPKTFKTLSRVGLVGDSYLLEEAKGGMTKEDAFVGNLIS